MAAMLRREKLHRGLLLAAMAAALALLFWLFPLTGDDWYREGLGRTIHSAGDLLREVVSRWKTTNPRICGNILAYLSGSRPVLREALRTGITLLLTIFAAKAAKIHSKAGYLLLAVGCFALPREMFRQIYPWAAGFFNYLPPVAALLASFCLLERSFSERQETPARCAALGLLAFSAQLFVENDTIYTVIAGGVLLLWCRKAQKRWSPGALCFFAGAVLGAGLLFASPSYRALAQADAAYQMAGGLAGWYATARQNLPELLRWMVADCPVIYVSLTAAAVLLPFRTRRRIMLLPAAVMSIAAVWFAAGLPGRSLAAAAWFAALGFPVLRCLNGMRRRRAGFFLCSAWVAAAPLALVTPIGPRCLFLSYVFLLLTAAQLWQAVGFDGRAVWQKTAAVAAALAVFAGCLYLFLPIHATEKVRRQAIASAMTEERTQIVLPQFPHAEYLWDADTQKLCRTYYYKTPGDIAFFFVPAEEWTP